MLTSLILAATIATTSAIAPPPVVVPTTATVQTGVKASAYHGKFYRKQYESKRRCIVKRESNGHYFSTNRSSGYFGAYQMNRALAVGAGWMMRDELKEMFGATVGTELARKLRKTEPHKWHRFYQDMAFWTIAEWRGDGSGLHHWRGGRFAC